MSLPKELRILGLTYRIEEVECVNKISAEKGEINFLTHEIKIDKSMPQDLKEQTLLHEVIHAVFDSLGMYELNDDERTVQSLATALYSTFKENFTSFS